MPTVATTAVNANDLHQLPRQAEQWAFGINEIWSMDFVADALFDGRKLRMLTVVDRCMGALRGIEPTAWGALRTVRLPRAPDKIHWRHSTAQ